MNPDARSHVHSLIDQLPQTQLAALETLLESMIDEDDEELTEEDRRALPASLEYFGHGGQGIPFEEVVADLGFTMDQVLEKDRE
ncbi:MAG TPA: hypothetical protein VKB79_22455 [Bryobacteraceae bacterium]|nr:hypothetical protein [Bryobacteraceae bacterium]